MSGWALPADSPLLALGADRSRFSIPRPPARRLPVVDGLLAGASEVDITPPPGMPKAGYSSNAHDGTGFRTRLRARVVHLRSGTVSIALVHCDLLGGSAVLHRLVSLGLAGRTDVPAAGLFIGATHTHAGPGQFLGTDFYNRFASNRSGFDPGWAQYLAERIAAAVEQAVAERRPAKLAFGATEVWGLTRNRSLAPHVANAGVADRRTEAQRKFFAINPSLHLLRVDALAGDRGFEPLAASIVFSVHGTGISQRAREYNADVWAYVTGELAWRVERTHGRRPVVGAVQGTHADVAPAIRPGAAGYREARRVGAAIGEEAAALYERLEPELRPDVVFGAAFRELDLDRPASRRIGAIELPDRPAVGAALVAGAKENVTPVVHRVPPFRAGSPKRHRLRPDQGAKWVLGGPLQPLVLPRRGFPRVLPVQILRVGEHALLGLPFEVTVEAGRRMAAASLDVLRPAGVEAVVVSSVANEYAGYVTTPEEYRLQFYEGGHTLYGERTEPYLTAQAARLAGDLVAEPLVEDLLDERVFDVRVRRFMPAPSGTQSRREVVAAARFVDPTLLEDAYWELVWRDAPPGDLSWDRPVVRVEASDGGGAWEPAVHRGRRVDDAGWDLEVGLAGRDANGGHRYRARWWDPELRGGRRHRFVLLANASQPEVVSPEFD